jgi:hypothetical protein
MNMDNKRIVIITGGTVQHIRPHFSACATAQGKTGRQLDRLCQEIFNGAKFYTEDYDDNFDKIMDVWLFKTRMAGGLKLETNEDISDLIDILVQDDLTKIIFMPVALCDWTPIFLELNGILNVAGEDQKRLKTSDYEEISVRFKPANKIINKIREKRKDIFLVGFKTTTGEDEDSQYIAGLDLCKKASCNLVLANDLITKMNMVITPEEARYHVTTNREEALRGLVEMTKLRSHLTFTRSTVVSGDPVRWDSDVVPPTLRTIVNWLIRQGAYKPFNGATAGHFAVKLGENEFLTSIRKTNFNKLPEVGLVKVVTNGPDTVIAYGAKPSVGGQSQRIVFHDHPGYDCIVHFHCPIKPGSKVPTVSQREYECGSHQCGKNTSRGLAKFGDLSAVYLDQHGPNIVFNRNIDAGQVINFIEDNFDLNEKTGGFVSFRQRRETPNTLDSARELL